MASVQQFLSQVRRVFGGQSRPRRMFTFLIVLGVAGTLLYSSFRRGGGLYAPLYPNLSLEDAAAVVAHLKTARVEYRLENDGTTISVPQSKIPELRMELAQMNLPIGGGVGFEWFDKPPIGMTDRVQEINYMRALQGELARSVATLQAVERARVILAMPRQTSFLRTDENKPSASVVLEIARGATLSPRNVEGILNLVSRAVEGLEPDRVALIDARTGETLNRSFQKPEDMAAEQNLAFRARYERDLENDIETMLERWVGKGKVVARVNADFDFRQTTTKLTSYNDDGKAVELETEQSENVAGLTLSPGGVVGTPAQVPGQAAAAASLTGASTGPVPGGSFVREKRYKVSETNTTTVDAVGSLKSLTVAAMVAYKDEEQTDPATGKTNIVSAVRSPEEIASLENLVRQAVGYTEDKADTMKVVVECVPFARTEELAQDASMDALQRQEMTRFAVTWGIYGLLGVLALLFVARPVLKALMDTVAPAGPMRPALAAGPLGASGELAARTGPDGAGLSHVDQARRLLQRADAASTNKTVEELLKTDPQRAAALLRQWLEENK